MSNSLTRKLSRFIIKRQIDMQAGGGPTGPLVYDTFTDTNGTALTAHTPDIDVVGGGWSVLAGTWTIQSNQAQVTAAGTNNSAVIETGQSNITITLNDVGGHYYDGIYLRGQDASNGWMLVADRDGDRISIYQRSGGNTLRAWAAKTIGPLDNLTLIGVGNGTSITLTCDAASCNYSSATLQAVTKHGLYAYTVGNIRAETITMETL